jgi:hypothetical protein
MRYFLFVGEAGGGVGQDAHLGDSRHSARWFAGGGAGRPAGCGPPPGARTSGWAGAGAARRRRRYAVAEKVPVSSNGSVDAAGAGAGAGAGASRSSPVVRPSVAKP